MLRIFSSLIFPSRWPTLDGFSIVPVLILPLPKFQFLPPRNWPPRSYPKHRKQFLLVFAPAYICILSETGEWHDGFLMSVDK